MSVLCVNCVSCIYFYQQALCIFFIIFIVHNAWTNLLLQNHTFLFILLPSAIVKSELVAANQQQAFGIVVLLVVLVISPLIIFLVR